VISLAAVISDDSRSYTLPLGLPAAGQQLLARLRDRAACAWFDPAGVMLLVVLLQALHCQCRGCRFKVESIGPFASPFKPWDPLP